MNQHLGETVLSVFGAFESGNIRYALLRDLSGALPNNYTGESDIDIIIHPEDWFEARQLLKNNKWFEVMHPFDNLKDFVFLYGMQRFKFFIRGAAKLDVCFQLACRSTNDGEWIPIDQEIQDSVWGGRYLCEKKKCYVLDPVDECVHLLARAFFDKNQVPIDYSERVMFLYSKIDSEKFQKCLELVFFRAAREVHVLVQNGSLMDLKKCILSFDDY